MKGKGRLDPKGLLRLGSQVAVSHKQSWKSARSMGVFHRIQVTVGVPVCPPISQGTRAQGTCGPGLHRVGRKSSHEAGSDSHSFPPRISHPLSSVLCSAAQSCLTLCNPLDYSLPASSVHGVFQARIPEWVATSSSREHSRSRDRTHVFCTVGEFLTTEPFSIIHPGNSEGWPAGLREAGAPRSDAMGK